MTPAYPPWAMAAVGAVFGAVFGSFLNVCVYRIPRGVSVVSPPSACPHCGARIAWYDNVPVFSWFFLRGRCRSCRGPISPRYPAVEAVTALVGAFLVLHYGVGWELWPAAVFSLSMIVVTLIDYDERIIPDVITLPGVVLGVAASFLTPLTLVESLAGAALGFLFLWAIAWGYRKATGVEGMGGGDIKLAAMLGAFLGWKGLLLTVFLASAVGSVVGLSLMAARRGGRRTALPFGTFLAPVAVLVYLWGPAWIRWYVGLLRR